MLPKYYGVDIPYNLVSLIIEIEYNVMENNGIEWNGRNRRNLGEARVPRLSNPLGGERGDGSPGYSMQRFLETP